MLSSRVEAIEQSGREISVTTKAGKKHTGSIVVGADGVHSTVRHEMRRLASLSNNPTSFPSEDEEQTVPCHYQCSFGIAKHVENWPEKNQSFTSGEGYSFLVASGPDNRVYWFMFKRLPEVKYGKDIPRYTKQDEEDFVQQHAHVRITEDLTFGRIFENRISSTLTPLHEIVFKKWFWERMILMGDSVHKVGFTVKTGRSGLTVSHVAKPHWWHGWKRRHRNGSRVCQLSAQSKRQPSEWTVRLDNSRDRGHLQAHTGRAVRKSEIHCQAQP